jgi:hypothetical protein
MLWIKPVILATKVMEIGRIMKPAWEKASENSFQLVKARLGGTCLSSQLNGSINKRITIQA